MILVPGAGVVIDNPGMRELGIISADLDKSFSDIEEIAKRCKFSDCQHESEPKCALTAKNTNYYIICELCK